MLADELYNVAVPLIDDETAFSCANDDDADELMYISVPPTLLLPPLNQYSIKYYRNEADALSETNAITNTTNYRNIGYPNEQDIWVRVESIADNSCFGLGPHVKLKVNLYSKEWCARFTTTLKMFI